MNGGASAWHHHGSSSRETPWRRPQQGWQKSAAWPAERRSRWHSPMMSLSAAKMSSIRSSWHPLTSQPSAKQDAECGNLSVGLGLPGDRSVCIRRWYRRRWYRFQLEVRGGKRHHQKGGWSSSPKISAAKKSGQREQSGTSIWEISRGTTVQGGNAGAATVTLGCWLFKTTKASTYLWHGKFIIAREITMHCNSFYYRVS